MLLQLNNEELQKIVTSHLIKSGFFNTDERDEISISSALVEIEGEPVFVVGLDEEVPDYLFNLNNDSSVGTTDQTESNTSGSTESKPETKGTGKKRKRRTKAEIEADEAKQRAEAQAEVSNLEGTVQAEPKQPEQSQQAEDTNAFGVSESAVEASQEASGAPSNPFGTTEEVEANNPFGSTETKAETVVSQSPDGFAKPVQDDDTINLFN